MATHIRLGIAGWNFAEWRGEFYPEGLPQKQELHYASRALGAIEINSTFYGPQKPESFAAWAATTPAAFDGPRTFRSQPSSRASIASSSPAMCRA